MKKLILALVFALLVCLLILSSLYDSEDIYATSNEIDAGPVVLITLESTRVDHVGPCYGYHRETAPHLCNLTEDGVVFENAYSSGTKTSITAPSMVYGRSPVRVGLFYWDLGLPLDGMKAMGERMNEAGYKTIRHGAHTRGGDDSLISRAALNRGYEKGLFSNQIYEGRYELEREVISREFDNSTHLWDFIWHPHPPYTPPSEYLFWDDYGSNLTEYEVKELYEEAHGYDFPDNPREIDQESWEKFTESSDTLNDTSGLMGYHDRIVDFYDAEIRYADEDRIRPVIEGLKEKGLYDDALIIVNSDHGQMLGEHGQWGHGIDPPRQGVVNVPFVVKFPGNEFAGETVSTPVSTVDVMPTLCQVEDVECPVSELSGQSLYRTIEERSRHPVFAYGTDVGEGGAALIDRDLKYLLTEPARDRCQQGTVSGSLFNVFDDPKEHNDLSDMYPEKVEEMHLELCERWEESDSERPEFIDLDLEGEMEERLRDLGYLQ